MSCLNRLLHIFVRGTSSFLFDSLGMYKFAFVSHQNGFFAPQRHLSSKVHWLQEPYILSIPCLILKLKIEISSSIIIRNKLPRKYLFYKDTTLYIVDFIKSSISYLIYYNSYILIYNLANHESAEGSALIFPT